ncbi:MAG: hypothetical protein GX230_02070 [Lentisphaerae bacterium]|jgi:predicted amidohydrolase|nr:hypothetical protein [Lentisphaerota bacterium]
MALLRVGAAQVMARFNDFTGNLALIREFAEKAATAGVDVLLFAEDVLHGSTIAAAAVEQALPADAAEIRTIGDMARSSGVTLLVGFLERDGANRYNSHLIAHADGTLQVQRKLALNGRELASGLIPGAAERIPFTIKGKLCNIAICADWNNRAIEAEHDRHGCEVVFLPTAGSSTMAQTMRAAELESVEGITRYIEKMHTVGFPFAVVEYCLRKRRAVVACNSLGDNGYDLCQWGHCTITAPTGEVLGMIPGAPVVEHQRSQMVYADLP